MARPDASQEVELNVTAMLDMAFQLLAFFILTFRSAGDGPEFRLHIPPAQSVVIGGDGDAGNEPVNLEKFQPKGVNTLRISVYSEGGGVDRMSVNDRPVSTIDELRGMMKDALTDPASRFEQVVLQVSSKLRYEETMNVVGVCSEQKVPMSGKLPRLSITMMDGG